MRKKKSKRGKNLLSYMSCNYDQTKLEAPLLTYHHAEYSRSPRRHKAMVWTDYLEGVDVAGFKSQRRAVRLVNQLNKYFDAHRLVARA